MPGCSAAHPTTRCPGVWASIRAPELLKQLRATGTNPVQQGEQQPTVTPAASAADAVGAAAHTASTTDSPRARSYAATAGSRTSSVASHAASAAQPAPSANDLDQRFWRFERKIQEKLDKIEARMLGLLSDWIAQQRDNRHRDRSADEEDVDEEGYETPDPRMDELHGMANE